MSSEHARSPIGPRQITAWLFCGVLAFGIVGSGAYFAVRVVSAKSAPAAPKTQPVPPPAPQPVAKSVPAPEPPKVVPPPVVPAQTPPTQPVQSQPAPTRSTLEITPAEMTGHIFLQVGAVERGLVDVYVKQLARNGFTVRVAEGPSDSVKRILLGPLERSEIEAKQAALKEAGFSSFQRNY